MKVWIWLKEVIGGLLCWEMKWRGIKKGLRMLCFELMYGLIEFVLGGWVNDECGMLLR